MELELILLYIVSLPASVVFFLIAYLRQHQWSTLCFFFGMLLLLISNAYNHFFVDSYIDTATGEEVYRGSRDAVVYMYIGQSALTALGAFLSIFRK